MRSRLTLSLAGGTLLALLLSADAGTQQQSAGKLSADWPMYRHDFAGTGYSPAAQIDSKNVGTLKQAWTYSLGSNTPPPANAGRGGAAGPNSEAKIGRAHV